MKTILYTAILISLLSCKTTKLDVKTGDRNPTRNTIHMRKVHPYGYWTGKGYIHYPEQKRQTVKQLKQNKNEKLHFRF